MSAHELTCDAPVHRIPWLQTLDKLLGKMVEIPAAMLVAAEILVLLYGVMCRYFFHTPVIWTDELASCLFLWLAMLGSVIALRRNEHMRMTALVSKASPAMRSFLEVLATVAPLLFLTLLVEPSIEFAVDEQFITTPAMGIVNS